MAKMQTSGKFSGYGYGELNVYELNLSKRASCDILSSLFPIPISGFRRETPKRIPSVASVTEE